MSYFIECKSLWKWYPSPDGRLEVLKGLDFSLEDGEFIAIIGASGVGKSTFLHVIGLLDAPSDGVVLFKGKPVYMMSSSESAAVRAKSVGFMFQFHHLLPEFTALENLLIPTMIAGLYNVKTIERARELLDVLGIWERREHFPAQLSGGEQQRVALARALMNFPELLIADEPTGNLDSENARKFMWLTVDIRRKYGISIVLATHNMEIAKFADKVFRLSDGKLVLESVR